MNGFVLPFESRNDLERFLMPILQKQPPRRIRHEQQRHRHDDGKDELEGQGEAPLQRAPLEVQAVVHPVGEAEGGRVGEGADDDELAADAGLGALGLEDGAGGRRQAHAEAVDDAADYHLGQVEGDDLEDGADDVAEEAEGDGLFAAEFVAGCEGEDGAEEGSELGGC